MSGLESFSIFFVIHTCVRSLRESWSNALNDAVEAFRGHLTSGNSSSWKRVPFPAKQNSTASDVKGKQVFRPEPTDALVHRKSTRTGDIYRVLSEIPLDDDVADLEVWRAVLVTPELRQEWDPAVESSRVIEMFDPSTRIVKTKFTLGWPAKYVFIRSYSGTGSQRDSTVHATLS